MKLIISILGIFVLLFASGDARRPRIHDGNDAYEKQFPYMALITYGTLRTCGASIIHSRWVLTAAHCVLNHVYKPEITVGTIDHYGTGQIYQAEIVYYHDNYTLIPPEIIFEDDDGYVEYNSTEVIYNDVAIIRLESDIQFNDKVRKIKLETDETKNYENVTAIVMGWGDGGDSEPLKDNLRFAEARVISLDECRKVWTYADKHVCTHDDVKGPCHGDSGSALVVGDVQIGIVSTSDHHCQSLRPDLYAKVASFVPWIKKEMSRHGDSLE